MDSRSCIRIRLLSFGLIDIIRDFRADRARVNLCMLVAVDVDWLVADDVDIVTCDVEIVLVLSICTIHHRIDISFRCDFKIVIAFIMIMLCHEDGTFGLDIRLSVLPTPIVINAAICFMVGSDRTHSF